MSIPFPGMDSCLEMYWGDVHTSLITYARDSLRHELPRDLRVRTEGMLAVEAATDQTSSFYPDVRIIERDHTHEQPADATE